MKNNNEVYKLCTYALNLKQLFDTFRNILSEYEILAQPREYTVESLDNMHYIVDGIASDIAKLINTIIAQSSVVANKKGGK